MSSYSDDNIKSLADKQRINPSPRAWDLLENKLDQNKRPEKKRFNYLALAASFVLVIACLVLIQILNPQANHQMAALHGSELQLESMNEPMYVYVAYQHNYQKVKNGKIVINEGVRNNSPVPTDKGLMEMTGLNRLASFPFLQQLQWIIGDWQEDQTNLSQSWTKENEGLKGLEQSKVQKAYLIKAHANSLILEVSGNNEAYNLGLLSKKPFNYLFSNKEETIQIELMHEPPASMIWREENKISGLSRNMKLNRVVHQ